MRDRIYNARRELSTKTAQDLGFPHNNKLYINESLTPKLRELLYEVKTLKRNNQFKFVWTRNGKVLLRKDGNPAIYPNQISQNMDQFIVFKDSYAAPNDE